LERGYALVEDEAGQALGAADIAPGQALTLRFHDATVAARAEGDTAPAKPARKAKAPPADRQPTLF
jgi:exonuclease VII large subunit